MKDLINNLSIAIPFLMAVNIWIGVRSLELLVVDRDIALRRPEILNTLHCMSIICKIFAIGMGILTVFLIFWYTFHNKQGGQRWNTNFLG